MMNYLYFTEVIKTYELNDGVKGKRNPSDQEQTKDKYALIHDAILLGIRDYFGKLGLNRQYLGPSGDR